VAVLRLVRPEVEVKGQNHNWGSVSPRDYFEALIAGLREEVRHERELRKAYQQDVEKALEIQAKEVERRFRGTNELREQYTADRSEFVRQETFETKHQALQERMDAAGRMLLGLMGATLLLLGAALVDVIIRLGSGG